MINYIIYNDDGKILRTGRSANLDNKTQDGEYIMQGEANDLTDRVIDGKVVSVGAKADPELELLKLRASRNSLLSQTDWTQVSDAPLTKIEKQRYKSYRKALRDLPLKYDTITDINNVVFPQIEDF